MLTTWDLSLVPKMAHAGEHHRHAMLIGGRDDLRIALAAARLDHGADAIAGGHVEVVAKGQERIRGHDRAGHRELFIRGLHRGESCRVHAAHLTCTDADGGAGAREHDGVGFHELAHRPGEPQVCELTCPGHASDRALATADPEGYARSSVRAAPDSGAACNRSYVRGQPANHRR